MSFVRLNKSPYLFPANFDEVQGCFQLSLNSERYEPDRVSPSKPLHIHSL